MKNVKPFELKWLLVVYNFGLVVLSTYMLCEVGIIFNSEARTITIAGLQSHLCRSDGVNGHNGDERLKNITFPIY